MVSRGLMKHNTRREWYCFRGLTGLLLHSLPSLSAACRPLGKRSGPDGPEEKVIYHLPEVANKP